VKYIIHDQVILSREPEGPLAAHLSSFGNAISAQGYNIWSLKRKVLIAACFSRWHKQRGVGVRDICFDHATRYLRFVPGISGRARMIEQRSDSLLIFFVAKA
jgi:integrase/recombinase XerD